MSGQKFYDKFFDFYLTLNGSIVVKGTAIKSARVSVCSKYIGKSGEKKQASGRMKIDKESDIIEIDSAQHEEPHTYSTLTEERIETLGEELFDAVFVGEVGVDFKKAYDETEQEAVGLRVLLDVDPKLTWFPWEIIRFQDKFLATEIRTPVLRIFTGKTMSINLKEGKMPRVLAVLSNLENKSGVDVTIERTNLTNAILNENSANFGGLEDILPKPGSHSGNPSLGDIETILNITRVNSEDPFNIVHFLAHGEFDEEKNVSAIVLQPTTDEETQRIKSVAASGSKIKEKLGSERSIGLVVLNACSTGRILEGAPSLVSELLDISPAVVAMRKKIGKDIAKDFTIQFYGNLTPQNAEIAIQMARQKLHTINKRTLDFSIPVLYLGCDQHSRIPVNKIFSRTTSTISLWTRKPKLNPAGVIAQKLLELHDKSVETENEWNSWFFVEDKDLKVSKIMPQNLLQRQLFGGFNELLGKTSQLVCTTFSHAAPIWGEIESGLNMNMKKLIELACQGGGSFEIREAINNWHQDYCELENLVCHIVTTWKEIQ
jgi:hypothetical protein